MRKFFVITEEMVTDLKLKGCERDVYAVIYGFCQDSSTGFFGAINYIVDITGWNYRSVIRAINELIQRGLVVKKQVQMNGVPQVSYTIGQNVTPYDKMSQGYDKLSEGMTNCHTSVTKCHTPSDDNKLYNKQQNHNNNSGCKTIPESNTEIKKTELSDIYHAFDQAIPCRMNEFLKEQISGLFEEVGGQAVMYGIEQASKYNKPSLAYVEHVARSYATNGMKPTKKVVRAADEDKPKADPYCPECHGTGEVTRYLDGDMSCPVSMPCPTCMRR